MYSLDPIVRDLEIMAWATNYRRWIYRQFRHVIGPRIIECGAGIGHFTEMLSQNASLVVAVDTYEPCLAFLQQRCSGSKNVVPVHMDISSPEFLDLARYHPDTIVCLNVLEHVQDDVATLAQMHTILPGGGKLALLVPAFQAVYGTIDRLVGHYRRYGKRELGSKLTQAGFAINGLFYMNCVALGGWWLNNRILKRREESFSQVLVFDRLIVPWLSRLERVLRPPFGLSLIAIAEK